MILYHTPITKAGQGHRKALINDLTDTHAHDSFTIGSRWSYDEGLRFTISAQSPFARYQLALSLDEAKRLHMSMTDAITRMEHYAATGSWEGK